MASIEEPNGIRWRVQNLEKRVDKLENLEPEVQAEVLKRLEKKVDTLTHVGVALLVALIAGLGGIIATLLALQ